MKKIKLNLVWAVIALLSCMIPAPVFATESDDLQARFDAAMQALEANQLNSARRLFNALLADDPTLHRARLELARANYLAADFAGARAQAELVLENPDLPPQVRTTVLAFLAQIRKDEAQFSQRHHWVPSLYLGTMYDSNVNFGVSRDIIDINGLPFLVAPGSKPLNDWAAVVDGAIAHTYNPGKRFEAGEQTGFFVWQSQASAYYRGYFNESDFSLGVATLRTGPTWFVPNKWRAGIGLQGDQIWLGGDNLGFYTSLNPNATWEFDGDIELTVEGMFAYRDYNRSVDAGRDGWYQWGGVRVGRYFNARKWGLQAGAGYFHFGADNDRFTNRGPDLFVGVVADLWTNGSVYARAGYRNYDFKGNEPGFNKARDDDEYRFITGFRHSFDRGLLQDWTLLGDWTYTDNRTNVALYEFDRHQLNLGLTRSF